MLDLIEKNPGLSPKPDQDTDLPRAGDPWVSKHSGRRGTIRWISGGQVKIAFNEHGDGSVLCLKSFLENYRKV